MGGTKDQGSAPTSWPPRSPNSTLSEACPDGRILRITNNETGETMDFACEDARAALPAYDLGAFQADPGPEQIGEAREKWSPLGILCSVAVAFAVGYGCDRSKLDWRACAGLGVGALACDLI